MKVLYQKIKTGSILLSIFLIFAASMNISAVYFFEVRECKNSAFAEYEKLFEKVNTLDIHDGKLIYNQDEKIFVSGDFALAFLADNKEILKKGYILFTAEKLDMNITGQHLTIGYSDIFENGDDIQKKLFNLLIQLFNMKLFAKISYTLFYMLLVVAVLSMLSVYLDNRIHGSLLYRDIWKIASFSLFVSSFFISSLALITKLAFIYAYAIIIIMTSILVVRQVVIESRE